VHLTLGTAALEGGVRTSQAVFYALPFFWLDGSAVPAPAQVTHTVGWFLANRYIMNRKTILSYFLVFIFIVSCAPAIVDTLEKSSFVTATPLSKEAITPPSSPESALTNTIVITIPQKTDYYAEVYYPPCKPINNSYLSSLNPGCFFMIDIVDSPTVIDLGNSFQVTVLTPIDRTNSLITVTKDGNEVYKTKIQRFTFSGLISAWGYENHWAVEVATSKGLDVIQDGESIKAKNGYDEVCGFQILSGKPFYFFRKSDYGYGIYYDDSVHHLNYDDIVCNNENPNSTMMFHNQNIVGFVVVQDGAWKSAIITTSNP